MAPLLGGIDQAFQFIQEYTGIVSPGILAVFMLGSIPVAVSLIDHGKLLAERQLEVRDHERRLAGTLRDAEHRLQRRERVIRDLRPRLGHRQRSSRPGRRRECRWRASGAG